jgi:hypothetical protein
MVGGAQWRATLQLLHRDGVLTGEQANRLSWRLGGSGTSIPLITCRVVARHLRTAVVPTLADEGGVRVEDRSVDFDDEATPGTILLGIRPVGVFDGTRRSTLLTNEWLEELATFFFECDGAGAIEEAFG